MSCVFCFVRIGILNQSTACALREDDTNWPKKSIVGKQELEIRVGNDHIAFEVGSSSFSQTVSFFIKSTS